MKEESSEERIKDLGYARVDLQRARRRGFPEVVFGQGKTLQEMQGILETLAQASPNLLATRVEAEMAPTLCAAIDGLEYDERARVLYRHRDQAIAGMGSICVVSAGTSDRAVACEAARCARVMGNEVVERYDVGVAGLHRLLDQLPVLREARVVICVAGMEAALPSVVAGLLDRPLIAVPTSVGYGAHLGGLAALLGCVNACSAGVTTVNIDNGFGAAYAASLMNRP